MNSAWDYLWLVLCVAALVLFVTSGVSLIFGFGHNTALLLALCIFSYFFTPLFLALSLEGGQITSENYFTALTAFSAIVFSAALIVGLIILVASL